MDEIEQRKRGGAGRGQGRKTAESKGEEKRESRERLRLFPSVWDWLESEAKKRGIKINRLIELLIEAERNRLDNPATQPTKE